MVYGTQMTIVTGAYKPTYNWGGPHCSYPNMLESTLSQLWGTTSYLTMTPLGQFTSLRFVMVRSGKLT